VYTWVAGGDIWYSHLDFDEVLNDRRAALPVPTRSRLPDYYLGLASETGTIIVWRNLDRLHGANWTTTEHQLCSRIARMFRYFLIDGKRIRINGQDILPYDPMFLMERAQSASISATQYGDVLRYSVTGSVTTAPCAPVSQIEVRFSEIPVSQLAMLSDQQKRHLGISNGAGVSIVRSGREIDYGWFFIDKRRENYDDWWRCEIRFNSPLDELFGVNQIKQGIRPSEALKNILKKDLSGVSRTLNVRARVAHQQVAESRRTGHAMEFASQVDHLLRPLKRTAECQAEAQNYLACAPGSVALPAMGITYDVVFEPLDEAVFYRAEYRSERLTVIINTMHDFYTDRYACLKESACPKCHQAREFIDLVLIALARSEMLNREKPGQDCFAPILHDWSRAIAVFCGDRRSAR
jgi:hypothetical protein